MSITPQHVANVLRIMAECEYWHGEISWHRFEEGQSPRFYVPCTGIFHHNGPDLEPVETNHDADRLWRAVLDCRTVSRLSGDPSAHLLYVARKRGQRPLSTAFHRFHKGLWPLFEACHREPVSNVVPLMPRRS